MRGSITTLVLSPSTTVDVAELDGYEHEHAEVIFSNVASKIKIDIEKAAAEEADDEIKDMSASLAVIGQMEVRVLAVCSIRKLNGVEQKPLEGAAGFRATASALSIPEKIKLLDWAGPIYSPSEATVKKEPSAPLTS